MKYFDTVLPSMMLLKRFNHGEDPKSTMKSVFVVSIIYCAIDRVSRFRGLSPPSFENYRHADFCPKKLKTSKSNEKGSNL